MAEGTKNLALFCDFENIALGYVRREHNEPGTLLQVGDKKATATVVAIPFHF